MKAIYAPTCDACGRPGVEPEETLCARCKRPTVVRSYLAIIGPGPCVISNDGRSILAIDPSEAEPIGTYVWCEDHEHSDGTCYTTIDRAHPIARQAQENHPCAR